jgi:hypothetical protein
MYGLVVIRLSINEVNGKWLLRKGKEREMKKDIGKEMNKVQNKSPVCIATDIPV